jgi:hypothetical protein
MITAHKKLTALKKLYEHHAKDCVRVAELTVDPRRREQYLKLAREWTEAAAALRVCIDEIDAAENGVSRSFRLTWGHWLRSTG